MHLNHPCLHEEEARHFFPSSSLLPSKSSKIVNHTSLTTPFPLPPLWAPPAALLRPCKALHSSFTPSSPLSAAPPRRSWWI